MASTTLKKNVARAIACAMAIFAMVTLALEVDAVLHGDHVLFGSETVVAGTLGSAEEVFGLALFELASVSVGLMFQFMTGLAGVAFCGRPEKAGFCVTTAAISLLLWTNATAADLLLANCLYVYGVGADMGAKPVVLGFALPAAYLLAAYMNKEAGHLT